ncbi:GDP-mannose 4,6-dehydratase [Colletotrichum tofieldiae]|uniref:GDP-mannose 4,6-dehydratase n=1 Tax=Colletotrichum tofieldiae TaxID=708197 RepID=A0A161VIU6_9PEZI|nr:GDP-mannose 4,6-dehydratase [Colletotrichum tofieldiae]
MGSNPGASLRDYLRRAYEEAHLTSEADLSTIQQLTGVLEPDRENLLLVYGGSFNPPHRGHIDALLSGLRPEVAAIAIVILPSEDFQLRHKMSSQAPGFFLHRKRRADIWGAIRSIPRDRVWVWTSTWYPFKPFMEALVRLTKADGFKLVLSNMIGPDNLKPECPLANPPYELPRILVTNRARHIPTKFGTNGKPFTWAGFGEWCRSPYGGTDDDNKPGQPRVILWMCVGMGDGNAEKRGYYLQYVRTVDTDINSTSLRHALVQRHVFNEISLNQLSTKDLTILLAPMLLDNH